MATIEGGTEIRSFRVEVPEEELADLTVAVTVFPGEQYPAPRSWAERAYPNLIYPFTSLRDRRRSL
jgi:hypothetical protein